jgi:hypothetical protein
MNHLIGSGQLNIITLHNLIDYPSTELSSVNSALHIHVFHTDNLFSKFAFKDGKYAGMSVSNYEQQQVNKYALKMALEGNTMSCESLRTMLQTERWSKKE